MFAAALIISCPGVEISIYSTCKRISQKLLRGVQKFIYLICSDDLSSKNLSVVRQVRSFIPLLQNPHFGFISLTFQCCLFETEYGGNCPIRKKLP